MLKVFKQTEKQKKYQEKFIEKAKLIHGDKYDYSKVNYINAKTKVCIICETHGEFEQTPDNHINQKSGCQECGNEIKRKKFSMGKCNFIKTANIIHNYNYIYELVKYKNIDTKVKIICKKHGKFEQTPYKHLQGQGCPKCGGTKRSTTEEFIQKSEMIHGDRYDYSKVGYKNAHTKVIIICPIHGKFEQRPADHINGAGCPKCGDISRLENSNYITGQYIPKYQEKYSGEFEPIYRSSYELKAFQMIEEDENILKWESETIVIPYELDGNINNYIVDLKIETKNGIKLIEIKPKCKLYKPKYDYLLNEWEMNQAKWDAAKDYCKESGCGFEIWTEKELNL